MLARVEYSVTVPVTVDAAFQAFQDLERLLNRGIYDEVLWIESTPWQVGSRLRYFVVRPVRATLSAVVTSVDPPRSISMLNHSLGITGEQNVSFDPDLHGGTRVSMTVDFVGKSSELSESAIHEAATFIAKDALDTMAVLCRRRASGSAS